jgi:hypothetical protein
VLKAIFSKPVLKKILYAAICIKVFFTLFIGLKQVGEKSVFTFPKRTLNADEPMSADVAFNYNNGLGFSDKIGNFNYGHQQDRIRLTAYRPTFPIVIHILYQRVYQNFSSLSSEDVHNINSQYYSIYFGAINIISLILFLTSISYFRRLLEMVTASEKLTYFSLIVYVLHPAILIYMGLYPFYENIVMPLLVISVAKLVRIMDNDAYGRKWDIVVIPAMLTICCLLRPHSSLSILLVLFSAFVFCIYKYIKKEFYRRALFITLACFLGIGISNGFIIYKNYKRVGKAVLSTQQSLVFFLGHNPYTRGSWNGDSEQPGSTLYEYRRQHIPNFENLTENELNDAHKRLAIEWIKTNPLKEAELTARKIALFALPYNNDDLKFNLITFLIRFGFFGYCFFFIQSILKKQLHPPVLLFSLLITAGTVLITIYTFFEHRFIYYAEPFMLITAVYFYQKIALKYFFPTTPVDQ